MHLLFTLRIVVMIVAGAVLCFEKHPILGAVTILAAIL